MTWRRVPEALADNTRDPGLRLDEPVVVLTCGRSGSTLLRLILDAHPKLACPPETSLGDVCTRMGMLLMLLEGPAPNGGPNVLSDAAADSIRSWVKASFAAYLTRRGKIRWCEKSLGSADSAGRLLNLFPKAKFICLYRHSMDVIDSMIEACPFGLSGYGLDPFVAVHPGNSVAAVADYWVCHTRTMTEFEAESPSSCLRVRYEDLVTAPEEEAKRIFEFLGEEPVASIATAAFAEAEQFGPADHKIWDTSGVHDDSLGRGAQIPVGVIPPPVIEIMNELLTQLGFRTVGEGWNTRPVSALADPLEHEQVDRLPGGGTSALDELGSELVRHIAGRLADDCPAASQLSGPSQVFAIIAQAPTAGRSDRATRCWRVDAAACSVTQDECLEDGSDADTRWRVVGDARQWTAVLAGELSLATALRRGRLRLSTPTAEMQPPGSASYDPRVTFLTWLFRSAPVARASPSTSPVSIPDQSTIGTTRST
jgi:hypothetical protein